MRRRGKGVSRVGAGKIVCGETAREALKDDGVQPDCFNAGPAPDEEFDFMHRRWRGTEIYFVRNKRPRRWRRC